VEAFGQTYIEALISKIPSVFTLSGIAREFVTHQHNAWVVDFKNSDQIVEGIMEIITNKELRERLIRNGETSIQKFSLDSHILALEKLYSQ
jgi:glycosyltransferase involved in cell wall biosynthesis